MVRMTYSSQRGGGRYFVGQEASTRVFREHITPREQPTMISTYEFLATWMRARFYSAFVLFYDGSEAAWKKKSPPDDLTFVLKQFDLGGRERRPGDASE